MTIKIKKLWAIGFLIYAKQNCLFICNDLKVHGVNRVTGCLNFKKEL